MLFLKLLNQDQTWNYIILHYSKCTMSEFVLLLLPPSGITGHCSLCLYFGPQIQGVSHLPPCISLFNWSSVYTCSSLITSNQCLLAPSFQTVLFYPTLFSFCWYCPTFWIPLPVCFLWMDPLPIYWLCLCFFGFCTLALFEYSDVFDPWLILGFSAVLLGFAVALYLCLLFSVCLCFDLPMDCSDNVNIYNRLFILYIGRQLHSTSLDTLLKDKYPR